jgi:hypothetical protein
MILLDADVKIKNIFDENIQDILEEKCEMSNKKDELEKMKHILNILQVQSNNENSVTKLRVWEEQPMHRAARQNDLLFLWFLTLLGGKWISENEHNRSPIDILLYKIENENIFSNFLVKWWISRIQDENGLYLIHYAAKFDKTKCLLNMIANGANIDVRTREGN